MLAFGGRPRGKITARTLVYFGWAVSTMTIVAVFITALDGYHQDYASLPSDSIANSERLPVENEGVETPNRRSLSADDSESLEILTRGSGRTERRNVRRNKRSVELLLFRGGSLAVPGSTFVSDRVGSFKKETEEKWDDEDPANSIRLDREKEIGKRFPTAWKKAKTEKITMEMQTQVERSRNPVDSSPTNRESQIGRRNLRLEEMPSVMMMTDDEGRMMMKGGRLPLTQIQIPNVDAYVSDTRVSASSADGIPVVEDDIYWSRDVEQLIPEGITDENVREFGDALGRLRVRSMEFPQWNRCGRPKNQFVVLEDDTPLCARYRSPQDTLIRGEVLSFYLSRLLALDNVPAVALSQLNPSDTLWQTQNLTTAQWTNGTFVALIRWMDDLNDEKSRVRIPGALLSSYESGEAMTALSLDHDQLTTDQLSSLVQWTDLILFDYITGHYDRVASMQDGAEREMRPSIMRESIRNLRQIRGNGKLVFIDNESGLFDGYELMYHGAQTGTQFLGFHSRLLRSTCVFRRRTVARIRWLAARHSPEGVLEEYASVREPLYRKMKDTPEVGLFRTYFRVRLKEIVDWINHCNSLRPR